MTGTEIVTDFELQVDDGTELSSVEELRILDRVYQKLAASRPWEWTKKPAALTQSTTLPYVALPSDFLSFVQNYDHATDNYYGEGPVAIVGASLTPVRIVPFSTRNQYVNDPRAAYIDFANQRLVFMVQPTAANSVAFDYHAVPAAITANTSPLFPASFHPMLVHGMAVQDFILQLSDKARSYAPENKALWDDYFADLCSWNAQFQGI